jgi:curved DNA-binding protein CbpA
VNHVAIGSSRNYYDLLQVSPVAEPEVIVAAFRVLAHLYHPDQPTGDAQRLAEIVEAYRVLADPEARLQYDATRRGSRPAPARGLRRRLAKKASA